MVTQIPKNVNLFFDTTAEPLLPVETAEFRLRLLLDDTPTIGSMGYFQALSPICLVNIHLLLNSTFQRLTPSQDFHCFQNS